MIHCKELNKDFESKDELFKALIANERTIIDAKKSVIYNSKEWISDNGIKQEVVSLNQIELSKLVNTQTNKEIEFDENYYYLAVNSANYLDSHNDVHLDGNWNQTVKSQQGKVYLTWSHDFTNTKNIIAFPSDIELMTANVSWLSLGKNYDGSTYCLIYKVEKNKIQNEDVKKWLEENKSLQLSVRMLYVKIVMALNSDEEEHKEYKKNFLDLYPKIVNKDEFEEEINYFWGVKEAKNVMESAILPFGSNSATGRIDNKNNQAVTEALVNNTEQQQSTQRRKSIL